MGALFTMLGLDEPAANPYAVNPAATAASTAASTAAASGGSSDQQAAVAAKTYKWYTESWIDNADKFYSVKSKMECETKCNDRPGCLAYAKHNTANDCYLYDHLQANTENGVRTMGADHKWGVGIRQ